MINHEPRPEEPSAYPELMRRDLLEALYGVFQQDQENDTEVIWAEEAMFAVRAGYLRAQSDGHEGHLHVLGVSNRLDVEEPGEPYFAVTETCKKRIYYTYLVETLTDPSVLLLEDAENDESVLERLGQTVFSGDITQQFVGFLGMGKAAKPTIAQLLREDTTHNPTLSKYAENRRLFALWLKRRHVWREQDE